MNQKKMYIDEFFNISEEETSNSFEVDQMIASTISVLNKKGYLTEASCSGHYLEGNGEEVMSILKTEVSKEALIDWLEQNDLKFIREDETTYYYFGKILGGSCYIKFNNEITLPYLPKNFEYGDNSVYRMINYFEDNGMKKTEEELNEEIANANNNLKEWVDSLPEHKSEI